MVDGHEQSNEQLANHYPNDCSWSSSIILTARWLNNPPFPDGLPIGNDNFPAKCVWLPAGKIWIGICEAHNLTYMMYCHPNDYPLNNDHSSIHIYYPNLSHHYSYYPLFIATKSATSRCSCDHPGSGHQPKNRSGPRRFGRFTSQIAQYDYETPPVGRAQRGTQLASWAVEPTGRCRYSLTVLDISGDHGISWDIYQPAKLDEMRRGFKVGNDWLCWIVPQLSWLPRIGGICACVIMTREYGRYAKGLCEECIDFLKNCIYVFNHLSYFVSTHFFVRFDFVKMITSRWRNLPQESIAV